MIDFPEPIYFPVSRGVLTMLQDCIMRFFDLHAAYMTVPARIWQARVSRAQDAVNQEGYVHAIVDELFPDFCQLVGSEKIMVQSNLYLRAARPRLVGESIGWHREAMFGGPRECLNVWMPVMNCTKENVIQYIPGSASIPLSNMTIEEDPVGKVPRYSPGHKIGLLYAPKRIVSGVDFSAARPLNVEEGQLAVFSGEVIHGQASNSTARTRISVDFRVVAEKWVGEQKPYFASGQNYFVPLER